MLQLFSWMSSSETDVTFSQQLITKAILEIHHAEAISRKRKLIAELHMARLTSSPSNIIAASVEQCDAYLKFLTSCLPLVHAETSIFFLALQLLVSEDDVAKNEVKINKLFRRLLIEDKDTILAFYHANPDKFAKLGQIKLMVAAEKVKGQLAALSLQLITEANPLAIAPLFNQNFEEPEQFATIILWFLQRGLSAEQIIKTNLLQNYLAYHIAWFYDNDWIIKYLYELLGQFPEAKALVEMAEKEQCAVRGFSSYSLTGVLCAPGLLSKTETEAPKFKFTLTAANFEAMYRLFGDTFLYQGIVASLTNESREWENALKNLLNRDTTNLSQLAALINEAGKAGPSPVLEKLAALINDATIERMFVKYSGAVLHFLPYKPSLIGKIGESDITTYLKEMQSLDGNIWNQVPQLIALLNAFKYAANQTVAIRVYKSLLDIVLQHPMFLDDHYLVKRLQKFSQAEIILRAKYTSIQAEFDKYVTEQMRIVPWTVDTYYRIEDAWMNCTRQLATLADIKSLPHACPINVYQLQAQLVKKYLLAYSDMVLDDFIKILGVDLEFLSAGINHYEHLLIEILASVDDEMLRSKIFAKFEADEVKKREWKRTRYGNETVLEKASAQGNSGYIKSIAPGILDVAAKITIVTKAREAGHWHLVEYVLALETSLLPQSNLKELLTLAAEAGQLPIVKLCVEAIARREQKHLESVLQAAAEKGHPAIAAYICRVTPPPNSTILASAVKTALQNGQYTIVEVIDNFSQNPHVLATIEKELGNAAESNKLGHVQCLCTLKNNAPTQTAIESAFIKAVLGSCFDIANYLYCLSENSPGEKTIDMALNEVVTIKDCLSAVKYVFGLDPSQKAIEQAFKKAAGLGKMDAVKYLWDHSTTTKPQVLTDAIKKADMGGHTAVSVYLADVLKVRKSSRLSSVNTLSLTPMVSPPPEPLSPVGRDPDREAPSPLSGLHRFGVFRNSFEALGTDDGDDLLPASELGAGVG